MSNEMTAILAAALPPFGKRAKQERRGTHAHEHLIAHTHNRELASSRFEIAKQGSAHSDDPVLSTTRLLLAAQLLPR